MSPAATLTLTLILTGPAGAGKSRFLRETLLPLLARQPLAYHAFDGGELVASGDGALPRLEIHAVQVDGLPALLQDLLP